MTRRPRLLDLYCGAGGASAGYVRAGFDVTGVDIRPQPHYPFRFVQADALAVDLDGYDAYHASPPCQAYLGLADRDKWPRLIGPTRDRLVATGRPYVIENVTPARADLVNPVQLCGASFGLGVRRHRLFESNVLLLVPRCNRAHTTPIRAYYGKRGWAAYVDTNAAVQGRGRRTIYRGTLARAFDDMGIGWDMTWDELREAIPPAYTAYIGAQLVLAVTVDGWARESAT